MSDRRETASYFAGPLYRTLSAAFGLLLSGLGVYVLFTWAEGFQLAGAALLLALGANLVLAAWRGTRSWLSRIGPLP